MNTLFMPLVMRPTEPLQSGTLVPGTEVIGNGNGVVVSGGRLVALLDTAVVLFDITAPAYPVEIGRSEPLFDYTDNMAVSGDRAYVFGARGREPPEIARVDLNAPALPAHTVWRAPEPAWFALMGMEAYAGRLVGLIRSGTVLELVVWEDRDDELIEVQRESVTGNYGFLELAHPHLFVLSAAWSSTGRVDGAAVTAYRIDGRLELVGRLDLEAPEYPTGAQLLGDGRMFVLDHPLIELDVTDPTAMLQTGTHPFESRCPRIERSAAAGDRLVMAYLGSIFDRGCLEVVDLRPGEPLVQAGSVELAGGDELLQSHPLVDIWNGHAYIAMPEAGLAVVDISADTPVLVNEVPGGVDCAGAGDGRIVLRHRGPGEFSVANVDDPDYTRWRPVVGERPNVKPDNTGRLACWIHVADDRAVVGLYDGYSILDLRATGVVTITASAEIVGAFGLPAVVNGTIVMAAGQDGLAIVREPEGVADESTFALEGYVQAVSALENSVVAAKGDDGVDIVNLADASRPNLVGHLDLPGFAEDVLVHGETAYVVLRRLGLASRWWSEDWLLAVVDLSRPGDPRLVGQLDMPGIPDGMTWIDGRLVIGSDDRVSVVGVSNAKRPVLLEQVTWQPPADNLYGPYRVNGSAAGGVYVRLPYGTGRGGAHGVGRFEVLP